MFGKADAKKFKKHNESLTVLLYFNVYKTDKMLKFVAGNSEGRLVYDKELMKYKGEELYKYYEKVVNKKSDL